MKQYVIFWTKTQNVNYKYLNTLKHATTYVPISLQLYWFKSKLYFNLLGAYLITISYINTDTGSFNDFVFSDDDKWVIFLFRELAHSHLSSFSCKRRYRSVTYFKWNVTFFHSSTKHTFNFANLLFCSSFIFLTCTANVSSQMY